MPTITPESNPALYERFLERHTIAKEGKLQGNELDYYLTDCRLFGEEPLQTEESLQSVMRRFNVPMKNIIVENRGRVDFGDIIGLSESLKKYNLLQPIVVSPSSSKPDHFDLVAGERRYRAALLLGWSDIPATLRGDLSPIMQKEAELEENISRKDMSWDEQGELLRQIEELKRKNDPKWTLEKTAALAGEATGTVSQKIKMAKVFQQRPELKAELKHLPIAHAIKRLDQIDLAEKAERMQKSGQVVITTDLKEGDCRVLIKSLADNSIDLLLTDPPYGLEKLEALRESGGNKMVGHTLMSDHHNQDIKTILETLRELAPEFARVLKPGSHFYMFCAFQYAGDFISALEPHLEFQPPGIIWDRGKPSTPGYGYNYLSNWEPIIYGYKPPRTKRLLKNTRNILCHPDVPPQLRMYPTEKPVSLLRELLENSTNIGDTILDPFAGSGSTLSAARKSGRRGVGFELNHESWVRAQERLRVEGLTGGVG